MWGSRVVHIPYGLPLDVYYPLERTLARKALGLPADGPILLFAADSVSDPRKGTALLTAALGLVTVRPLTLLTVGRDHIDLDLARVDIRGMGHLTNERLLALAYSAADLLIHPALADNLPNVVMEAMSCGTPTVAFPIGGLPDLVRTGTTGWLAATVAAESLADAITGALDCIAQGQTLRDSCRAVCEAEYSLEQQAARYLALFRAA
jgi:glycosyltransferase involved in cell wall biosynthesis